ncbi:MAG: HAMP domain-containing histidine kinase [Bacteroidales bacterium]|nr:HAMP domain-containing histidine kinase [Bacteroidales bacterium]
MNESNPLFTIQTNFIDDAIIALKEIIGFNEQLPTLLEEFFIAIINSIESENIEHIELIMHSWLISPDYIWLSSQIDYSSLLELLFQSTCKTIKLLDDESLAFHTLSECSKIFLHAQKALLSFQNKDMIAQFNKDFENLKNEHQNLNQTKSNFTSIAAHELKTPLTLIEGYASILQEQLSISESSDTYQLYFKGIQIGVKRLLKIIDNMIDVSLIENRLLNIHFQQVWINKLFSKLEKNIQSTIKERKLQFEIIEFPEMREVIFGDPERLMQLFTNVVDNCIKYTPDGGRISVCGSSLSGFLEIQIQDTGIGISPENQVKIFQQFSGLGDILHHSSSNSKFKGGGPGLGLHISKGIVEAHGGSIWVESEGFDEQNCPGSTFHILLPLATEINQINFQKPNKL